MRVSFNYWRVRSDETLYVGAFARFAALRFLFSRTRIPLEFFVLHCSA